MPSSSPVTPSLGPPAGYPDAAEERTRWILARRGSRNPLEAGRANAAFLEEERTESGEIVPVATIFLANRECPWTCLMCDLWVNTLEKSVPPGAIPGQIRKALAWLPQAQRVKLYNAGSFFDPRAIPPADYGTIADLLAPYERIVVESHPALVGDACDRFCDLLGGRLEVAMGLETAHPEVLARLNKGMTTEDFRRAAAELARRGVPVRAFLLVGLPFLSHQESREWCRRSAEFAFDCGAWAVSLIPTRGGNGALDALTRSGEFLAPTLGLLEACAGDALALRRGLVLADLWDLDRLAACANCSPGRRARLERMNREQALTPREACAACGEAAS